MKKLREWIISILLYSIALLLLKFIYQSFSDFKNYPFNNKIDFFEDFDYTETTTSVIDFSFMPFHKMSDFKTINEYFKEYDRKNNEILNLVKKNGFEFFYELSVNKILCNLKKENYLDSEQYKSFMKYTKEKIINNLNLIAKYFTSTIRNAII